jgi:very-short-patch-repair endonuclease
MGAQLDFTSHGLVRRRDLAMTNGAITRAVNSGRLLRLFPGIYAKAVPAIEADARLRRAALLYAGAHAHLSCLSACAEWGIAGPACELVHVTTARRRIREVPRLRPHRRIGADCVFKGDVPVSPLDAAVVEAFGCLRGAGARRSLLIAAISGRHVQPDRLRAAAARGSGGRPALLALLDDIAGGSHSEAELELLKVIRAAGLPEPSRQLGVVVRERVIYLDVAFAEQRLAIEVDGRAWHFNAQQRSADIRRDVALGAAGWLVLRFLYEQITNEPRWVAEQIRAALSARQATP